MWLCIFLKKKAFTPDPVRDAKYQAFVRLDYLQWSYFTTIFTHFFFWPRFCAGWIATIGLGVIGGIIMIGQKKDSLAS